MGTGKLIHYGFDLILISMLLAAIRRNTGLQLLYEGSDFRKYISKYLSFGEYAYDKVVSLLKISGYFHIPGFFDRLKSDAKDAYDENMKDTLPRTPPSN